ncbi:MAG: methyltransferase domain-containing protein [Planctomycetaceae bacterium]
MDFHCQHFSARRCQSCDHLPLTFAGSVSQKQNLLAQLFPGVSLQPLQHCSDPNGTRIRARMAVDWKQSSPTFGFFDQQQRVVPVEDCPLHHPLISQAVPFLREFLLRARLTPFDPDHNTGELKFAVLTAAPDSESLMIQWVLRSQEAVSRIRSAWRRLSLADRGCVRVMGIGIQPLRTSQIAAELELNVSEESSLRIRFGQLSLFFGPGSFIQTNHEIAARLYQAAGQRIAAGVPGPVLDLYCGAGGFGLMAASHGRAVLGLEKSAAAVENARRAAVEMGFTAEFRQCSLESEQDLLNQSSGFSTVICNPPRRGLDAASLELIQRLAPQRLLYSSCSPLTLARDLRLLAGNFRPVWMQGFDMFPLTEHFEVLCELERTGGKN